MFKITLLVGEIRTYFSGIWIAKDLFFSVKSDYSLLIQNTVISHANPTDSKLWEKLWKATIHERLKVVNVENCVKDYSRQI